MILHSTSAKMAEFRHLIRIANTDLHGNKSIVYALKNIKGLGVPLAHAVCHISKIDSTKKVGDLSDSEVEKLNTIIKDPIKNGIPTWMVNRRNDMNTGTDMHIITNDLIFTKDNDIKQMKRIKSYRGVRHSLKLPVRGQRTRSNFRANKGKVMGVKTSGKKGGPSGG